MLIIKDVFHLPLRVEICQVPREVKFVIIDKKYMLYLVNHEMN